MDPTAATRVEPSMAERFRGALVGTAVGDAFASVLGEHEEEVPAEAIAGLLARASVSVDGAATTLTTSVAESLLFCGALDEDHLARTMATLWLRRRGLGAPPDRGPLDRLAEGAPPAQIRLQGPLEEVFESEPAMQSVPAALMADGDLTVAVSLARRAAAVTHKDGAAIDGAGIVAAAAALMLQPASPAGPRLIEALEHLAIDPVMRTQLHRVARLGRVDPPEAAAIIGTGPTVLETVPAALWALVHAPGSFSGALVAAAALGGLRSAILPITGAIAGARHGVSAVPTEWRISVARADALIGLADRFLARSHHPR
ncbi:MAG: ADP-ribosylglycohydrolase family protein [Acidimicrobiales bacterium]